MKEVSDKGILFRIKEVRNEKGYSQEYVAEKLGMKQSGYALLENGRNSMSLKMLLQIAIIIDVEIINLIGHPFKYIKEIDCSEKAKSIEIQLNNNNDLIEYQKAEIIKLKSQIEEFQKEKKLLENNKPNI